MPGNAGNIARLADARRKRPKGGGTAGGGPSSEMLMLDPKSPMETADAFLQSRHLDEQGRRLLCCQGGVFYRYDGIAHRPVEEAQLEKEIYDFLRPAYRPTKDGAEPFDPDQRKVRDIVHALRARVHLSAETAAPAWLGEAPPDLAADDILACRNCLLHLPTLSRLPHTPDFFTLNSLDFDYDPEATCPRWERFLPQVADADTIEQIAQMFGYLLTPDTRQQKTFLLIGPPRSGKGTTGRILQSLVGERNTVSPGLSSLATTFGREQLLGKRLALISDARLSSRTDQGPIIETILSISGEDPITIMRKFLPSWSGRLPLRFVMLSNELPAFIDIAGAFVSRFVILRFPNSFLGKEDPDLTDTLLAERPGILNWALAALARLREAGRFVQPPASADLLQRWADLSSPIIAFLRTQCVIEPDAEVIRDDLFDDWKDWRANQGYAGPTTKAQFGKALVAKVVGLAEGRAPPLRYRRDAASPPASLPRRSAQDPGGTGGAGMTLVQAAVQAAAAPPPSQAIDAQRANSLVQVVQAETQSTHTCTHACARPRYIGKSLDHLDQSGRALISLVFCGCWRGVYLDQSLDRSLDQQPKPQLSVVLSTIAQYYCATRIRYSDLNSVGYVGCEWIAAGPEASPDDGSQGQRAGDRRGG